MGICFGSLSSAFCKRCSSVGVFKLWPDCQLALGLFTAEYKKAEMRKLAPLNLRSRFSARKSWSAPSVLGLSLCLEWRNLDIMFKMKAGWSKWWIVRSEHCCRNEGFTSVCWGKEADLKNNTYPWRFSRQRPLGKSWTHWRDYRSLLAQELIEVWESLWRKMFGVPSCNM